MKRCSTEIYRSTYAPYRISKDFSVIVSQFGFPAIRSRCSLFSAFRLCHARAFQYFCMYASVCMYRAILVRVPMCPATGDTYCGQIIILVRFLHTGIYSYQKRSQEWDRYNGTIVHLLARVE